ncbi:hypothetical protein [Candidatus Poseidonia alphae]|uniref:hypothetical protein n=1 Tax=Candidatus Poseidonia alphae TaxID=1915863 RepID=UPI0030C6951B
MGRASLAERISALDTPEEIEDVEAIWRSLRPILILARIVLILLIILVGEMFDDVYIKGFTVGIWAMIAGIPLFVLMSLGLLFGDRYNSEEEENTA